MGETFRTKTVSEASLYKLHPGETLLAAPTGIIRHMFAKMFNFGNMLMSVSLVTWLCNWDAISSRGVWLDNALMSSVHLWFHKTTVLIFFIFKRYCSDLAASSRPNFISCSSSTQLVARFKASSEHRVTCTREDNIIKLPRLKCYWALIATWG